MQRVTALLSHSVAEFRAFLLRPLCRCGRDGDLERGHAVPSVLEATLGFFVLNRQTGLLDPGMLVNIQQPLIREDGTVLLATDSKVMFSVYTFSTLLLQCSLLL